VPEAIRFPRQARRLERRRIINDTSSRSIKPPASGAVDYFDDLTPGLSLRVTSNDVRTWTVFYRDTSARQKRLTLGRYPAVKLVDARELAPNAQRSVAHGGDPVVEKRAAREVLTFGKLAETYIDDYAKLNKQSWEEDERQLKSDLLPKWRSRPAIEIRSEDLLSVLNAKVRNGSPVAANRLRALVIQRIWDACDTQNPYVSAWFRLRLVTAQRVYLNELARKVLATVPRDEKRVWVFPKSFMGDYKHVGRRLAQSTRANILAEAKAVPGKRDKVDIRGHDMASGGVPRFVISRILNHSEEKEITSVYDRYSDDAEKKAAMDFWNRQLTAISKRKSEGAIGRFRM